MGQLLQHHIGILETVTGLQYFEPWQVLKLCREHTIDQVEAFSYLASLENTPEGTKQYGRHFVAHAIKADDNLLYDLHKYLVQLDKGETREHLADRINDNYLDKVKNHLSRAFDKVSMADDQEAPTSVLFKPMPRAFEHGIAWVEVEAGIYEPIAYNVLQAELQAFGIHHSLNIRTGIAKAFEDYFPGADDSTLSYIIEHKTLPEGQGKLMYNDTPKGRKADAVRFCKHIHMAIEQFNGCFTTASHDTICMNAWTPGKKDYDISKGIYTGIYIPMSQFQLIDHKLMES